MLYDEFNSYKNFAGADVFKNKATEKTDILKNLNPAFPAREYQKEALGRFFFYQEDYQKKTTPTHLMFNMATGSGKTLVMAAEVLYLYGLGYRNFLFFTRLDNIVQKTRDNFLNQSSKKYLFTEKIVIDGQTVNINEVDNFEAISGADINIMFCTTSLLHTRLNAVCENSISYEDFEDKKIVLLADEAHNLSADTSGTRHTVGEQKDKDCWEKTVLKLLTSNPDFENMLLEFTATARLEDEYPEVMEKYKEKAIFKYDLKSFREDGYSKNVKTLQVTAPLMMRVLTALVISQYRRKVAEKNKIALKPVVLFKANRSSTPTDPTALEGDNPKLVVSSQFKLKFHELVAGLTDENIQEVASVQNPLVNKAFEFFKLHGIDMASLSLEIKNDFGEEKCLSVDDDNDTRDRQQLLNSLEDADNGIRAVFATEKLNEGWDVLNLFDIVRLYDSRDARSNRPGRTTVQEAQLIGRGARYSPFVTADKTIPDMRKFDDDTENELAVLEYLYYHSAHNPRYIQELENVLKKDGIMPESKVKRFITIKPEFKDSWHWKEGVVYLNDRIENNGDDVHALADVGVRFDYRADWNTYQLKTMGTIERDVFADDATTTGDETTVRTYGFSDFGRNVIRTGMSMYPSLTYERLSRVFGNVDSVSDFIDGDGYLGLVQLNIRGTMWQHEHMSQDMKLQAVCFVLSRLIQDMEKHDRSFKGSKTFIPHPIKEKFYDKVLLLDSDSFRAKEMQEFDLEDKEWYAQNESWGTSEEESLLGFIDDVMAELIDRYDECYLVRNEMHVKIHSFDDGSAFYPDFILFLRDKLPSSATTYQIFIEPKGDGFLDMKHEFNNSQEGWKEKLLLQLGTEPELALTMENSKYRLIGLPFYNAGNKNKELNVRFEDSFRDELIPPQKINLGENKVVSFLKMKMVGIPLVGSAPCGNPMFGKENIEKYIEVEKNKIKPGFNYFILRAIGDSMNLAGINDGDLVLCRQQLKADTGDRVVALLGDNVTIKVYGPRKDGVRLLLPNSSNSVHAPITPNEGDSVQGIVQEVLSTD